MITQDNEWADGADELDGVALLDKAELVGVPFLITGLWFQPGANDVNYVYVEGVTKEGEEFTINDSSTGIRAQLTEYLGRSGRLPEAGETVALRLLVSNGLRVSEYDVMDKGRTKKSRTHYLTTSGKRRVPSEPVKPVAKTARTRKP
jgi:hypothetical protein